MSSVYHLDVVQITVIYFNTKQSK